MSARDAASLLFVGLGILAGITALGFLQGAVLGVIFMTDADGTTTLFRALTLLPAAILGWFAFALVRDRARYAARLFPEPGTAGPAADRRELQLLGVTLIGLFVLVRAIPGLAQWLIELGGAIAAGSGPLDPSPESRIPWVGGFAYATLDLAAGLLLVAKRHQVREYLFERDDVPETAPDETASEE